MQQEKMKINKERQDRFEIKERNYNIILIKEDVDDCIREKISMM